VSRIILGKHTVVAEAFDFEEAAVGRKADGAQGGEIVQARLPRTGGR
jgi:hypothetical protein